MFAHLDAMRRSIGTPFMAEYEDEWRGLLDIVESRLGQS